MLMLYFEVCVSGLFPPSLCVSCGCWWLRATCSTVKGLLTGVSIPSLTCKTSRSFFDVDEQIERTQS